MQWHQQTLHDIPGIGEKTRRQFNQLGIHSIGELLLHLPFKYQNRWQLHPIGDLIAGQSVLIQGKVTDIRPLMGRSNRRSRAYASAALSVSDDSGSMGIKFFNISSQRLNQLSRQPLVRCFGEVQYGNYGMEMVHPDLSLVTAQSTLPDHWHALYRSTQGLPQYRLRQSIEVAVKQYLPSLPEIDLGKTLELFDWQAMIQPSHPPDPSEALTGEGEQPSWLELLESMQQQAITLKQAIEWLHFPPLHFQEQELAEGCTVLHLRLILEELVSHQLSLQRIAKTMTKTRAVSDQPDESRITPISATSDPEPVQVSLLDQYLAELPFALTTDQAQAMNDIKADLQGTQPMMRLIQGDVGSGKTIVAILSMLVMVQRHWQCVLMAPTELLAKQHFLTHQPLLKKMAVEVELLIGKVKVADRRKLNKKLQAGTPMIVIGTHAVFQQAVEFKHLGLIVIDEQHRFGVNQRLALLEKSQTNHSVTDQALTDEKNNNEPSHSSGSNPMITQAHQLLLTATPIPRTLCMTLFSDLSQSIIRHKPPNRQPIKTVVMSDDKLSDLYKSLQAQLDIGKQVYWVCPFIEESEHLQVQSISVREPQLRDQLHCRLGVVHGKMDELSKQQTLQHFRDQQIQLLLATTVIEVGIDVPNASIMIIEHAERMGLSQLHQLRGRVGRGSIASQCILLYSAPLSATGKRRLAAMRDSNDGFYLAELDLKLRGSGDLLGTRQSGLAHFYVVNFARDFELIPLAKKMTKHLDHQQQDTLVARWKINADRYVQV